MVKDTADDWKAIGDSEPWYGVLTAPEFLRANLTEEAKESFYDQGRREMHHIVERIETLDPTFAPTKGLDFGSGLGRLTFAMAQVCANVTGVDVSPGMIAEAEKQKSLRGHQNVVFSTEIPISPDKFDWVNSYIVLQHIAPETGYGILRRLLGTLSIGGWASIQLTFAHDVRGFGSVQRDAYAVRYDGYAATILETKDTNVGEMAMYDYDLNKVLFIFVRAGFGTLTLTHTDHGGMHGFWIFGKRNA